MSSSEILSKELPPKRLPMVALVGRPNVGKSTLFNRICRQRKALVDDYPGVTRDRNYAVARWDRFSFIVVDTGGFQEKTEEPMGEAVKNQAIMAIEEADLLVFLGDGKHGLTSEDEQLCNILRKGGKPVIYAVNKIDGPEQEKYLYEYYQIGMQEALPLSASHGYGFQSFMNKVVDTLKEHLGNESSTAQETDSSPDILRLAVVGRPNVGKSSLVNRLIGDERILVSSEPGTTRDAIDVEVEIDGQKYLFIDTAGIRRKGKTKAKIEKLSVIKAIRSIERCDIALLMVDGELGITDQDSRIAGYIFERARGCIVALNKLDLIKKDRKRLQAEMDKIQFSLKFMPYAPIVLMSALTGEKISSIFPLVKQIHEEYRKRISTSLLNQFLEKMTLRHEPAFYRNRRVKFFYATQVRTAPPTIVVFCNSPQGIHFSYKRYMINEIRKEFSFKNVPVRLLFRARTSQKQFRK